MPLVGGAAHGGNFANLSQSPSPLAGEGWGEGLLNFNHLTF